MSTLETMKARIADDLARSDLTNQIAAAITTAIEAYQTDRFFFNETREFTFNTVIGQDFYGATANANIPNLINIDWATIVIGGNLRTLCYRDPETIDYDAGNTTSTGQPYEYTYYEQQIRLYPNPTQVWQVRVNGVIVKAAPAADDEANNPWMTFGERMIRSRAKYELAVHVLRDADMATLMSPDPPPPGVTVGHEAYRAFSQLKGRTNRMVSTGRIRPYC